MVCYGDFNELLSNEEKFGCRLGSKFCVGSFQNFLDDCMLL